MYLSYISQIRAKNDALFVVHPTMKRHNAKSFDGRCWCDFGSVQHTHFAFTVTHETILLRRNEGEFRAPNADWAVMFLWCTIYERLICNYLPYSNSIFKTAYHFPKPQCWMVVINFCGLAPAVRLTNVRFQQNNICTHSDLHLGEVEKLEVSRDFSWASDLGWYFPETFPLPLQKARFIY